MIKKTLCVIERRNNFIFGISRLFHVKNNKKKLTDYIYIYIAFTSVERDSFGNQTVVE